MKKFLIVLLVLVAIFVAAYAADINDIRYDVNVLCFKLFVRESGLYCAPGICLDVIRTHDEMWVRNTDYVEKYGPHAPYNPRSVYKFNEDVNAYIRIIE